MTSHAASRKTRMLLMRVLLSPFVEPLLIGIPVPPRGGAGAAESFGRLTGIG